MRLPPLLRAIGLEPAVWVTGLLALALLDPRSSSLPVLCPLRRLGLAFCPGCGLGLSISHLVHGDVAASFGTHPLGIPAAALLVHRIGLSLPRAARAVRQAGDSIKETP